MRMKNLPEAAGNDSARIEKNCSDSNLRPALFPHLSVTQRLNTSEVKRAREKSKALRGFADEVCSASEIFPPVASRSAFLSLMIKAMTITEPSHRLMADITPGGK